MEKRFVRSFAVFLIVLLPVLAGCAESSTVSLGKESYREDAVFQVSTINGLLQGLFDGEVTCGELKKKGDLGIGTFDGLDGEMILVDGRVLQVKASGKVRPAPDWFKTPFATVVFFSPQYTKTVKAVSGLDDLQVLLDDFITNRNMFSGIRIDGTFSYVKTRSVPRQVKPYPPLVEATKNQPEFEMRNVRGTIVGFYCPPYVEGINVPGYHLHFVTQDRSQGGHLLECVLEEGKVQMDPIGEFRMKIPTGRDFADADLTMDLNKEMEEVEKGGGN